VLGNDEDRADDYFCNRHHSNLAFVETIFDTGFARGCTEAEKVFCADLEKNPRSGRSLFGLVESLKAQGKTLDAQFVQKELEAAWRNADTKLRIEEL